MQELRGSLPTVHAVGVNEHTTSWPGPLAVAGLLGTVGGGGTKLTPRHKRHFLRRREPKRTGCHSLEKPVLVKQAGGRSSCGVAEGGDGGGRWYHGWS